MAFPILAAGSLLGGLMSLFGHRRQPLTPEELARFFGPEALGKDTTELFNTVINSPQGQALIQQAQGAGARISQNVASRLAQAGIAGGGGESGVGSFAAAAGQEAGNVLQQKAKGDIFANAMQAAMQNLAVRAQLAERGQEAAMDTPTTMEKLGGFIAGSASKALADATQGNDKVPTADDLLKGYKEPALSSYKLRGNFAPIGSQSSYFAPSGGLGKGSLADSVSKWYNARALNPVG